MLLTPQEACIETRLSDRTLERHRVAGTGPKFVRLGRRVFYRREDLVAWIEASTASSTAEADANAARRDRRTLIRKRPAGANQSSAVTKAEAEEAGHPYPPLPCEGTPLDSDRDQTRNKTAGISSAHDEGQSGGPDQHGDPGSTAAGSINSR